MRKLIALVAPALLFATTTQAQDLDSLMNASSGAPAHEKVIATFKTTRIVNAQSTETAKKSALDFRITHRFGNMGVGSDGGGHTLWGFDDSRDIRFSFDYGICDNLMIGVGRSKMNELLDGNVKWRFLEQTIDNKVPLSIALYASAGVSPVRESELYSNVTLDSTFTKKFAHRCVYTTQIVIARKFSDRFSFELIPGFTHRNLVKAYSNPNDTAAKDKNDLLSVGVGFRFKLNRRTSITADYFYLADPFRRNNPNYFDPIGVGIEWETGGHVFNINLTNAAGITECNYLPNTTDNWLDGGYKLGFNISRTFATGKRNKTKH